MRRNFHSILDHEWHSSGEEMFAVLDAPFVPFEGLAVVPDRPSSLKVSSCPTWCVVIVLISVSILQKWKRKTSYKRQNQLMRDWKTKGRWWKGEKVIITKIAATLNALMISNSSRLNLIWVCWRNHRLMVGIMKTKRWQIQNNNPLWSETKQMARRELGKTKCLRLKEIE